MHTGEKPYNECEFITLWTVDIIMEVSVTKNGYLFHFMFSNFKDVPMSDDKALTALNESILEKNQPKE